MLSDVSEPTAGRSVNGVNLAPLPVGSQYKQSRLVFPDHLAELPVTFDKRLWRQVKPCFVQYLPTAARRVERGSVTQSDGACHGSIHHV